MCAAALPWLVGALAVGSAVSSFSSPQIQMPDISAYQPAAAPGATNSAPEAPVASPIMGGAQGQTGAEDEASAQGNPNARARRGRNILRIDRTDDSADTSGLAGGGLIVPR